MVAPADGVFAIAITLLVLDFSVPSGLDSWPATRLCGISRPTWVRTCPVCWGSGPSGASTAASSASSRGSTAR
ncbi:TMEM175 family protein [Streptomyces lividans]|uniref:TMEM175 family protein n=1 Tax=Streptomyces TaxID=1883 RepID=UPI0005B4A9B5